MARGKTLGELLTGLRVEMRASLNVSHNVGIRDTQVAKLQATQEWLWEDYTWPHLRVERFIQPTASQRFYDLDGAKKLDTAGDLVAADDLRLDRVDTVHLRDGTIWSDPLKPGIDESHFNLWDSDIGQTAWPIERWRVSEDDQLELWPIPSLTGDETTLDNMVKVVGTRNLSRLTEESDTADLDDRLIVLFAAADMIDDEARSRKKLALANKRLLALRGNLTKRRRFRMFGKQQRDTRALRGPPTVYYRTT